MNGLDHPPTDPHGNGRALGRLFFTGCITNAIIQFSSNLGAQSPVGFIISSKGRAQNEQVDKLVHFEGDTSRV